MTHTFDHCNDTGQKIQLLIWAVQCLHLKVLKDFLSRWTSQVLELF